MLARLIGISLVLMSGIAAGQTLYVTDQLVITVRPGPSTQFAVIENLVSGDAVEVLDTNEEGNYIQVRTPSGVEGWVLSQYLADVPSARDRLVIADQNVAEAEVRIATLEETITSLTEELETTSLRLGEAEGANSVLTTDLADIRDASENVLSIRDQNESLRRRLNERDQQVELLTIENDQLNSSSTRDWFIVGAGVLLAGIIVGLIVPRLRPRRRSSW